MLRTAWLPEVVEGEGSPRGSRFGGRPWLPEGTDWPRCPNCGRSMHLFVQLELATTPHESVLPPQQLLQLFYCTSSEPLCEVELESFAPFGRAVLARRVSSDGAGSLGIPSGIEPFPAREITGWRAQRDAPHDEEHDGESGKPPLAGDKWLGWPAWIQGVEYPDCRVCGEQMSYLLQIDSECNVPWMFGDMGTGHLSVCAEHLDEFSFHWACS